MKETGVRNTPASSGEEAAPNPPDSGELRPPVPDYPQNPAGADPGFARDRRER